MIDTTLIRYDLAQLESSVFGADSLLPVTHLIVPADVAVVLNRTKQLCDSHDELERKLAIAVNALNEVRKADEQSEEEFNPSDDMEKALDGVIIALKQIRGDND